MVRLQENLLLKKNHIKVTHFLENSTNVMLFNKITVIKKKVVCVLLCTATKKSRNCNKTEKSWIYFLKDCLSKGKENQNIRYIFLLL